jgi:membrane dipeptidase
MIDVENGYPIGEDLSNIKKLYDLGARCITLCHNGHNQICDSCNPNPRLGDRETEHGKLSPFGRQVIAEMNRLGMIVDVSHVSPNSFRDVVQASRAPVIASHSGCRRLCEHPRNLDDWQLQALAGNGGVVQVVTVAGFLKAASPERRRAMNDLARAVGLPLGPAGPRLREATSEQRRKFQAGMKEVDRQYPPIGVKDYVDHIEHAVGAAGVDHVGVGSDFDGGGGVAGFHDHSEALNVTVELVRRGYCEEDIKKIWGGNILRVWRDVEKTAARLQSPTGAENKTP